MPRLLVVTAVEAERDAFTRHLPARGDLLGFRSVSVASTALGDVTVLAAGAGPAAAAAGTSAALAAGQLEARPFDFVLNVGIAGGFDVELGSVVSASAVVFADFGAEDGAGGFLPADELGFGQVNYPVTSPLASAIADRSGAAVGPLLSVATVTGELDSVARLRSRHPRALAEAMEGVGVAAAATEFGVGFGELRTISNHVGPRDRDAWRIPAALDALAAAAVASTSLPWP